MMMMMMMMITLDQSRDQGCAWTLVHSGVKIYIVALINLGLATISAETWMALSAGVGELAVCQQADGDGDTAAKPYQGALVSAAFFGAAALRRLRRL